jgi:hypothetical protein
VDFVLADPEDDETLSIVRLNARRQNGEGNWVESYPGQASTISVPVPRIHARELAFVHGFLRLWGEPYDRPVPTAHVMNYRIVYESGREVVVPVFAGQHFNDIRGRVNPLPSGELAFQTQEADGEDAGETSAYYLMRWRNPHPEEKIKSIEIEAMDQPAEMPVVLAISYSESEVGFD